MPDENRTTTPPEHREEHESHEDKDKLKRKAKRVILVIIIIAVVLAIWGIASRLIARSHLKTRTAQDSEMTVVTVKPERSDGGDELTLPGTVQPFVQASIYARTSGYLKAWYTDIGTQVHKGQLLAEIETPEVDRQLGQARADLAAAQANAALAKSTNERWQGLVRKQAVSKQDADQKSGDAASTAAQELSAEQNLARLKELESFKRVVAPFDGVVTARNTDVGALINAGQASGTELFQIADTKTLRVYAQVPEAYAGATSAGLHAELHFAEKPGESFPVEAVRTSDALDPAARTLQVELHLDNAKGEFFPGAYTDVIFKLPRGTRTLRLPANTVLFRAQGLQVATVDPSRKIKMKDIIQGRDFGKTIEVLDGIDANDDVVVNPSDSIDDGMAIRIAPPKDDAKDGSKEGSKDGSQNNSKSNPKDGSKQGDAKS